MENNVSDYMFGIVCYSRGVDFFFAKYLTVGNPECRFGGLKFVAPHSRNLKKRFCFNRKTLVTLLLLLIYDFPTYSVNTNFMWFTFSRKYLLATSIGRNPNYVVWGLNVELNPPTLLQPFLNPQLPAPNPGRGLNLAWHPPTRFVGIGRVQEIIKNH